MNKKKLKKKNKKKKMIIIRIVKFLKVDFDVDILQVVPSVITLDFTLNCVYFLNVFKFSFLFSLGFYFKSCIRLIYRPLYFDFDTFLAFLFSPSKAALISCRV